MFDLFRSRQKNVRYLLAALLTLVALSMVITLVPGYGGGWGSSAGKDPTLLAEIGDERVTAQEVRQFISREMRSQGIPKGMEQFYIPMIVQTMVAQRAVALQAGQMGIRITDQQLAEDLRSLLPMLWENGRFAGKEAYAQFLSQQNMTIPQFEANVRTQALQTSLEVLALEGVIVTPSEVEEEYRRHNDKIKVAYFGINQELFKGKVTATPAEVEEYWKKVHDSYRVTERKSYTIFAIDENRIAETLNIPETELQRAYNSNPERFRTPERVKARHILLKTSDKKADEVAKIQKRMEDMLKQVKGGADFGELARKNSEDTGSAAKGGDLDFITRGQTVPEFEKAAFTLKPGEISALVKTVYGFHIIKVEAHEQAHMRPFTEVKGELAKEVAKAQVFSKMQSLADQIRSLAVKNPAEAEKLATANGVTVARAEKVGAGDPVQEVGINPQFNEAVASLPKNGVTQVVQIGPSKLVVAQVLDVFPAHAAQFADVEKLVRDNLLVQKANQMVQDKVKEAGDKLKSINGDLAGLAKQYGAELKSSDMISREAAITGVGAASSIDAAYAKNVGDTLGPIQTPSGFYFFKVLEKQPADLVGLAAQRDQMLLSIKSRRSRERQELFAEGIVQALIKQKKVKLYDDNIRRLAASYRS